MMGCLLSQVVGQGLEVRPLDDYQKNDQFKLHSGDLVVAIDPRSGFTIENIFWKGKQIGKANGHYGMVVCFPKGEWVGTGHREGGVEKVLSVSLSVDGKPTPIVSGSEISGKEITLVKRSLYRDHIQALVTLTIKGDQIIEKVSVDFLGDVAIEYWYPFMYVWPETTTHWAALNLKGERISGEFESNKGWQLQQDVRWTALYDPKLGIGALTRFPEGFPAGQGRRHAYWDLQAYHKQYFMAIANKTVPSGTHFDFEVEVTFFGADSVSAWEKELERLTAGKQVPPVFP